VQKAQKLWYVEVKALDSVATRNEYTRHNNNFIKWHTEQHGNHTVVEEAAVREYI